MPSCWWHSHSMLGSAEGTARSLSCGICFHQNTNPRSPERTRDRWQTPLAGLAADELAGIGAYQNSEGERLEQSLNEILLPSGRDHCPGYRPHRVSARPPDRTTQPHARRLAKRRYEQQNWTISNAFRRSAVVSGGNARHRVIGGGPLIVWTLRSWA